MCAGQGWKGPLEIATPANWEVEVKGNERIPFYTVKHGNGNMGLLIFSRWPQRGNGGRIPALLDNMAKAFIAQAQASEGVKLESEEYKLEALDGGELSGQYVMFKAEGGVVVAMFMLSDGEAIWNGQFTGKIWEWPEAEGILKGMKKAEGGASPTPGASPAGGAKP